MFDNVINDNLNTDILNETDLSKIEYLSIDENFECIGLYKLDKLINLKELFFNCLDIYDNNIKSLMGLKNLKKITFNNCCIYCSNNLGNLSVNSLTFINCKIQNIYYINQNSNLTTLYIDSYDSIDLSKLKLDNLKTLVIRNTKIVNDNYLLYLDKIEKLDLSYTGVDDLNLCMSMNKLKLLVVDDNQLNNNRAYLTNLKEKNVKIIDYMNREVEL